MKKETYEKPTIKTEKIELGAFGDYGGIPHSPSPNMHGKGSPLVFLCSQ